MIISRVRSLTLPLVIIGSILFFWWLWDYRERQSLVELGKRLEDLVRRQVDMDEVESVLGDEWQPAASLRQGDRIIWRMEVLKYRGYSQGAYFLEFDARTGRLVEVRHYWSS